MAVILLAQIRSKEILTESRVDKMKNVQVRDELKKRGLKTPREAVGKAEHQNPTEKRKRTVTTDHKLVLKDWIKNEKSRQDKADKMMRARIASRIEQFREVNGHSAHDNGTKGTPKVAAVTCWNPYDYLERRRNPTIQDDFLFDIASELFDNVSKSFENCSAKQVESMIEGYEQTQPKYARYEKELEDHDVIVAQLNRRKIQLHESGVCNFHNRSFPGSKFLICVI